MIGRLIHRIKVREKTKVPDGRGGYVISEDLSTWTVVLDIWATVMPMDGKEIQKYSSIYPEVTTKILIRHNSELSSEHVIEFGNKIYEVLGFINPEEKDIFDIVAAKEVPKRGKYAR
jgi:SPP1 family predicted phage head-tail adaptor